MKNESSTTMQKSGGKVSGESTGLPHQNTRKNLNDTSARKFGRNYGSTPESGGLAEKGYNREEM